MFLRSPTRRAFAALCLVAGLAPTASWAETDADRITALERQVEALSAQVQRLTTALEALAPDTTPEPTAEVAEDRVDELARRQDILAGELEKVRLGEAAAVADQSELGLGPAASKVYRSGQGVSLGGYGEMLYRNFDGDTTDELDFLRAIVYVGYKFDDRWLFNSEIEFEHASTSGDGSVSVEFAYLDRLIKPEVNLRAGMVLVPMGFLNELHEPTVFLGATRPDVERVIIPSTWRENGVGVFGEVGPVTYRSYVVNGLDATGFSSGGLRGGRQKGSKALAEDLAWVGRVDVEPTPGLLFGASAYLGDSGQGLEGPGGEVGVSTTIAEVHTEWLWKGLRLRALAARAELGDVAELNAALGLTGSGSVGEVLEGGYVEVAYDVLSRRPGRLGVLPYARWESFDTQAEVPAGFVRNPARDVESLTLGVALQPIDQIILKLDYQDYDDGTDRVNVALGYIF